MVKLDFLMANVIYWAFGLLVLTTPTAVFAQAQQHWKSTQSEVRFIINNAGLEVEGNFKSVDGTFITSGSDHKPILIIGQVAVKSIDTGIALRDAHLQGKDYFHASQFPNLRMQLVDVSGQTAKFNVQMRGRSMPVAVPFEWRHAAPKGIFTAEFKLNRKDFGVGGASWLLSEEVLVKIRLELEREP
jgi:polyisoprenoid-binding protein YceI